MIFKIIRGGGDVGGGEQGLPQAPPPPVPTGLLIDYVLFEKGT